MQFSRTLDHRRQDIPSMSRGGRTISGSGTDEGEWNRWSPLSSLPSLDLRDCRRAVVVAPHPDDEALGVGGTIAELVSGGSEVVVVSSLDGEAQVLSEFAHDLAGNARHVTLQLGRGSPPGKERALARELVRLLRPVDWCLATWDQDGHPDHESVGRAAAAACRLTGARLLGYPIWTWHWAAPADDRVPWHRLHRLALSESGIRRKQAAIAGYTDQTVHHNSAHGDSLVVPPADLAHFARPYEVVFA